MSLRRACVLFTLPLFLGGCVTLDTRDQLREGMSKAELASITAFTTTYWDDPFISPNSDWRASEGLEIIYADGKKYFYLFSEVTRPTSNNTRGNGKLHSVYTSLTSARRALNNIISSRQTAAEPDQKTPSPPSERRKSSRKKKKIKPLE